MKTLSLLRHAKSSWDDPALDDAERPLADRGRAAAPRMGRHMADNGPRPDTILCSPARRTRETLALLGDPGLDVPVRFDPALYGGGPDAVLDRVRAVDDAAGHVLVIGHNPDLESLAAELAARDGSSDADALGRMERKYPTAALAVFRVPADSWADVRAGGCPLLGFTRPKDL